MAAETNIMIQLLTGGQSEHVTVVCDNGEIKINAALLVTLYTIFRNLVRGLKESKVILFKGMQEEDLILLFQKLAQQVTEFSIKEQIMKAILSILVTHELDSDSANTSNKHAADQEYQDLDCSMDYPTEIVNYLDEETPVVIKIKKPSSFRGTFYTCHICGKEIQLTVGCTGSKHSRSISRNKIRSQHLSSVHGFKLEKCEFCGMECVEIKKHLEKIHQKCPICEKMLIRRNLKKHLKSHQRKENVIARKINYQQGGKEKTICPYCNKLYFNMYLHIRERCENIEYEKEVCKDCGLVFNNKGKLRAHVKQIHREKPKSDLWVCNICGKVLTSENALVGHHKRLHEIRELIHKCEKCGKMFGEKSHLKSHLNKTHLEKTPCPICGVKVRKLQGHMEAVHTKDEDKKFQCQDCGKGFMAKNKLEAHRINMHLKTKPYACRYGCDISYNDDSNRNAHEKKTHGKLFTTVREEKLKEKIESLGLDEKSFTTGIM